TTVDSASLIESWAEAWSSPNGLEKLFSLVTDDCIFEDLGTGTFARGKEEIKSFFESIFHAVPDFKKELTSQFSVGNWAASEWTMSGTQTGDFPSVPATNNYAAVRGASVFELQGNKIKRCSEYWDMTTYLKQIGLMPSD
ncbi:MAG TPA: ester cyclase, partial [Ktedonobacteraceae bacterium]|nr:ester cyclase [Ktedonobacteraceae bacterium]